MIEVKDAVKTSFATFAELFPSETFQDLRLEEVGLSSDERSWSVTVSYRNPDLEADLAVQKAEAKMPSALLGGQLSKVPSRHLKRITIKADDGSLLSIANA
jgi:hypothetical protein